MPLFLPPIVTQPDPQDVSAADATAAPTLYTVAHINALVTLANANKAKINALMAAQRKAGIVG